MKTKKCHVEPTPEPPPPDPCQVQKRKQLEKAGVKICEKPPVQQPPPPPECTAICIEKVKNPPVPIKIHDLPVVCEVKRQVTGTARCDDVEASVAAHPDLPWPGCAPTPSIPPPPSPDPCEEQAKRFKLEECRERMKRYRE
ncbi:PREDICTED: wiskott-Aldrich syndrome protein family member 1-like [Papilio polytes]|uniref:wiskott-Aldrich syndrome protein family member 1-like n=1 Tax=Papilio polytes TaxID=76194 RepID=UPI0006769CC1|nr:PREDICTED: wiskott-Aldrich syndrome protein family member 1-like [Papilio polytes]